MSFPSGEDRISFVHKTTRFYQILFYLKLIVLSFIFCLPKAEMGSLERPNFYKIDKTETSALLIVNHSQIETKVVKKSGHHLDFILPDFTAPLFYSLEKESFDRFIKVSSNDQYISHLKARAPPVIG